MTSKKKRFLKLRNNPQDTPYFKIKTILKDFGYELARIRGSHFIFKDADGRQIRIAVHDNQVKKIYVKEIINKLYEEKRAL